MLDFILFSALLSMDDVPAKAGRTILSSYFGFLTTSWIEYGLFHLRAYSPLSPIIKAYTSLICLVFSQLSVWPHYLHNIDIGPKTPFAFVFETFSVSLMSLRLLPAKPARVDVVERVYNTIISPQQTSTCMKLGKERMQIIALKLMKKVV